MRLAWAAAALLLAACGSAAMPIPDQPSPGSPPPALAGAITNQSDGQAVSVHLGDRVDVALTQQPGFGQWSNVNSGDLSILVPTVNPAAAAVRGVTLRSFRAIGRGTTDLTAGAGPDCSPGQACPQLARLFKVTVTVV